MATITMHAPLRVDAPRRRICPVTPVHDDDRRAAAQSRSPRMRHVRPVRLTRRGRLLVLALLVAVAFGALSLGRGPAPAATEVRSGAATAAVVVAPGDTLWSLAVAAVPNADPRETIVRIRELNPGLESSRTGTLVAGQSLVVPIAR